MPSPRPILNKRAAARLAAVQALYQVELTGGTPAAVAQEFQLHRLGRLLEPLGLDLDEPAVDAQHFLRIVNGVAADLERLDTALGGALAQGWTLERCGFTQRACLRAAAFELASCTDIPVRVVINEYVELAKTFLSDPEAGFVNAVLDRLSKSFREVEAAP